jgi:nucleotide-binding universal stress UspA family protein
VSFETVVVPIDGSTMSKRALPAAAAIATAGRAALRLVAVAQSDRELASLEARAGEAALSLPAAVATTIDVVVDDDPAGALLGIAGDADNVLCFASHGHTEVVAELLSSVGSTLMDQTSHPFVVVGPNGVAPVADGDVVVALDGSDQPDLVLQAGAAWAARLDAPLRLVTVFEPVPEDVRRPEHYSRSHGPPYDAGEYLRAMRGRIGDDGPANVDLAAIADPIGVADGLERHLADRPAFLLVVGSGHKHGPSTVLRRLLRRSPPPVLVVQHHALG